MTRLPRPALLTALALVLSLLASACGSVLEPPAATVAGRPVPQDLLDQELALVADHEGYRTALEQQFQSESDGAGTGTVSAGFAANVLTFDIYYAAVEEEVQRRGLEVGQQDLEAARAALVQQLGGEEVLTALPEEWQQRLVEREAHLQALRQALGAEAAPTGDEPARTYYEQNPEQFEQRCLSAILVRPAEGGEEATRARAEQLRARVVGGEDFAAVAAAESDDPQSGAQGGVLGCAPVDQIQVPALAQAVRELEVGEVTEPIPFQGGYVIVSVTSVEQPPFEEVEDQVRARLEALPQAALNEWLAGQLESAEIDVNPRYGRWVPGEGDQLGRVQPPTPLDATG